VVTPEEIAVFAPLFVALGGVVLYFTIKILPQNVRSLSGVFTALWLFVVFCLMLAVIIPHASYSVFPFIGLTAGLLITGIGAIAAWASQGSIDPKGPVHLYYPLFLFALAGAVAIGFSTDLFTIFVMVELSAIPIYALCAYRFREDPTALASAIQYLIQGVAGTITALLGVAILFMAGHTLNLNVLPKALAGANPALIMIAGLLIFVGYGVKLAIVPMHTWLPNAYAHAPVGVTAIMVGATKIGILIAMFLSLSALPGSVAIPRNLGIIIIFFAIITMTAGNLLALNQPDLRYVLGYSSVAQMGYILLGFGIGMVYNLPLGFTAGLYYAIAYSLMKAGAFLTADAFACCTGSFQTAKMNGQGTRYPLLGIAMVIFIFGLSGVPFTAGFLGKLLLEQAGMVTSMMSGVALALVLALNSAISLGYYVPIMSTIIFPDKKYSEGKPPENIRQIPVTVVSGVVLLAIITVYFGLFPESFDWIYHASSQLFTWGVP
jgi:NADH:ubiquinone oxidoreductase subunit 2 (subunit N)